MAQLINGNKIAEDIHEEIKSEVTKICGSDTIDIPGLAVVIVGTRKDSQTYVRLKHKAAQKCGFASIQVEMPETTSQEELEAKIMELNRDPKVTGMIVQLPLPKHIDTAQALELIDPSKDVDGLHPINVGLLNTKGKEPFYYPCTPMGVMELLRRSGIDAARKRACVIGRSNIVGLPAAQLLLQRNATVTLCHSHTENVASVVREADIVVAACGVKYFVQGSWIKPGACVIDVGTNSVADKTNPRGYRLVGDVCFDDARKVAGLITPVPGGVGPMTIAMLLKNTLIGFKRAKGLLPKVLTRIH